MEDYVKQGHIVICIGNGVRVAWREENRSRFQRKYPSPKKTNKLKEHAGGVRVWEIAEKMDPAMPETKKEILFDEAKRALEELVGSCTGDIVVLHDIDDCYDELTNEGGPTFMDGKDKDDRVKLCLQTYSSNQTRFDKLYPKVSPPKHRMHILEPYSKEEMRRMVGADESKKFDQIYKVFGGIPRRWFEPRRWSKKIEADTKDEEKVANFVDASTEVAGHQRCLRREGCRPCFQRNRSRDGHGTHRGRHVGGIGGEEPGQDVASRIRQVVG